ncbi:MAG TPA: M48 family metalloprotease [Bryobacteraceae bacterium]|nr:M48 family metalloprotease [Bryobacteraceae bacterium]
MRFLWLPFLCVALAAQNPIPARQAAAERQMLETVHLFTTPVEPQAVQDYVAQLGARLAIQLPAGAVPYSFVVVDFWENGLPEALLLPGGHIFVPLRLLQTAKDEAEFAGMLAQAIALAPLLKQPDFMCGNQLLCLMYETGNVPMFLLRQRRAMEFRADTSATAAMSRAGFDPAALLRYIQRVQPSDQPNSPLPPRAKRIAALRKAISILPPTSSTGSSDEFSAVQKLARPAQAPAQTSNSFATWARPSLVQPSSIR